MSNIVSIVSPIVDNQAGVSEWVILCDFDGTISLADVTDTLLQHYGMHGYEELEEAWLAGQIGSRECMGKQIQLLDASKDELDYALDTIALDAGFKTFVAKAKQMNIPLRIVSDGLDYAIHRILNKHGFSDIPVYANRLVQTGERSWTLEFPYAILDCKKGSGNCKCACVKKYQVTAKKVLFIGDGSSDFCASGQVNYVLAKSSLIQHCVNQNIPHLAIDGFSQATHFLMENLASMQVK